MDWRGRPQSPHVQDWRGQDGEAISLLQSLLANPYAMPEGFPPAVFHNYPFENTTNQQRELQFKLGLSSPLATTPEMLEAQAARARATVAQGQAPVNVGLSPPELPEDSYRSTLDPTAELGGALPFMGSAQAAEPPAAADPTAPSYPAADINALATAILGEARSENYEGKLAVAHAINNRALAAGITPSEVVRMTSPSGKAQFSFNTDSNLDAATAMSEEDPEAFQQAVDIATSVLTGQSADPTGGATYYHAGYATPDWTSGPTGLQNERIGTFGTQVFYGGPRATSQWQSIAARSLALPEYGINPDLALTEEAVNIFAGRMPPELAAQDAALGYGGDPTAEIMPSAPADTGFAEYAPTSLSVPSASQFAAHPAPEARMSSGFGLREQPAPGASTNHPGNDFSYRGQGVGPAAGMPAVAANTGTVTFAGTAGGHGNRVEIDHGAGNFTTYSHLDTLGVSVGDVVEAGQPVGEIGATGISTGPHLHFEQIVGGVVGENGRVVGEKVDPASELALTAPTLAGNPAALPDFGTQVAAAETFSAGAPLTAFAPAPAVGPFPAAPALDPTAALPLASAPASPVQSAPASSAPALQEAAPFAAAPSASVVNPALAALASLGAAASPAQSPPALATPSPFASPAGPSPAAPPLAAAPAQASSSPFASPVASPVVPQMDMPSAWAAGSDLPAHPEDRIDIAMSQVDPTIGGDLGAAAMRAAQELEQTTPVPLASPGAASVPSAPLAADVARSLAAPLASPGTTPGLPSPLASASAQASPPYLESPSAAPVASPDATMPLDDRIAQALGESALPPASPVASPALDPTSSPAAAALESLPAEIAESQEMMGSLSDSAPNQAQISADQPVTDFAQYYADNPAAANDPTTSIESPVATPADRIAMGMAQDPTVGAFGIPAMRAAQELEQTVPVPLQTPAATPLDAALQSAAPVASQAAPAVSTPPAAPLASPAATPGHPDPATRIVSASAAPLASPAIDPTSPLPPAAAVAALSAPPAPLEALSPVSSAAATPLASPPAAELASLAAISGPASPLAPTPSLSPDARIDNAFADVGAPIDARLAQAAEERALTASPLSVSAAALPDAPMPSASATLPDPTMALGPLAGAALPEAANPVLAGSAPAIPETAYPDDPTAFLTSPEATPSSLPSIPALAEALAPATTPAPLGGPPIGEDPTANISPETFADRLVTTAAPAIPDANAPLNQPPTTTAPYNVTGDVSLSTKPTPLLGTPATPATPVTPIGAPAAPPTAALPDPTTPTTEFPASAVPANLPTTVAPIETAAAAPSPETAPATTTFDPTAPLDTPEPQSIFERAAATIGKAKDTIVAGAMSGMDFGGLPSFGGQGQSIVDTAMQNATVSGVFDAGTFWGSYNSQPGSSYGPNVAQASFEAARAAGMGGPPAPSGSTISGSTYGGPASGGSIGGDFGGSDPTSDPSEPSDSPDPYGGPGSYGDDPDPYGGGYP